MFTGVPNTLYLHSSMVIVKLTALNVTKHFEKLFTFQYGYSKTFYLSCLVL